MKFTTERKILLDALRLTTSVAGSGSVLPILANILITVKGNEAVFTATDSGVYISLSILVKDSVDGVYTLPAKLFSDIVKSLPESNIIVSITEKGIGHIKSEATNGNYRLTGLPGSDFPVVSFDSKNEFIMNKTVLQELIRRTMVAVAPSTEMKISLTGINFEVGTKGIKLTSSDRRRIAFSKRDIQTDISSVNMIVPECAIKELYELMNSEEEDIPITISFDSNKIRFSFKSIQFISSLLNDVFPKVKLGFDFSKNTVKADSMLLSTIVKRVMHVSYNEGVLFKISGDRLTVSASSVKGDADDSMFVNSNIKDFEISFKGGCFLDGLSVSGTKEVLIEFADLDKKSPTRIRDIDSEESWYIVMPIYSEETSRDNVSNSPDKEL